MNFTDTDLNILKDKGIQLNLIQQQLEFYKKGMPVPALVRTASINDGIFVFDKLQIENYVNVWNKFIEKKRKIVHFIPASGRARRFFRGLYDFLDAEYNEPTTSLEKIFFKHIESFAFYGELNEFCLNAENKSIEQLIAENQYKLILEYMLTEKGLNYNNIPNSLFKFHFDESRRFSNNKKQESDDFENEFVAFENTRTPIQESMCESALISGVRNSDSAINMCFTINPAHKCLVEKYIEEFQRPLEKKLAVKFNVKLQTQSQSTDTIIVDENNQPYRNIDNNLIFNKGGHGALFNNLNKLKTDIVFIKNIDNQAPDSLKKTTVRYKKMLAGCLVYNKKLIRKYMNLLEKSEFEDDKLIEIINYVENHLNIKCTNILRLERKQQIEYLIQKINRPIRVCGVVKNEEEKGGIPCWVKNDDNTSSLQIIEHSQICKDSELIDIFNKSTHFNPVDIVCSLTDYNGVRFDLSKYADNNAFIILTKLIESRQVKRMEYAGLWNGCMANWNTIFVEVPIKTFNPVKNINDLLRHEHQNI